MSKGARHDRLDVKRRGELYSAVVEAFPLSDKHRAELKSKRGLTDATIDRLRFRSGGKHAFKLIVKAQEIAGATDTEMVRAGLLKPRRSDGKLFAWGQLLDDRVLIPYLDRAGETAYHLRPHKLGVSSEVASIEPYCEHIALGWSESDVLILTEGEFKAAAAAQLGYRALAVPGISSFAAKHFARLEKAVKAIPYKRLVVLFDRETKADPSLPGYKDDFTKRYDVEYYAWLLAHRLEGYVGQLPESWMEEGKADIDGAVADGRSVADFDEVIRTASAPAYFLNRLSDEAGAVVMRKVRRELKLDKPAGLMVFDSRSSGCGYAWEEEDGERVIQVSNFIMKLERVVQTDEHVERIVRIIDENGETGPLVTVGPDDISSLRAWRRWCAANGEYSWPGGQTHLDAVWRYLYAQSDGALIRRTVLGGEIESGLWLFQNGIVTDGRYVAPRSDDGLTWISRRGYEMAEPDGQPRILSDAPESARELGEEHAELLELMRENQKGSPLMWLCLGWAVATVFSRVLYNRFKCFPLLFCMGEAGSGKTSMARYIMNGFFGIDTEGKPMMSTEKSQYRLLAKRCSLPAWFDEFRETRDMARHVVAFCSIYNRQAYARAKRTGDLQTDSVPVRGSLLLAGVVPPSDDQLLSRCLLAHFDENARDNRDEEEGGTYHKLEARLDLLNDFMLNAVLRFDELVPEVIAGTLAAQRVFHKETGNARMALNYGMAVAGFHAVCGELVDSKAVIDLAKTAMSTSGERLKNEHPLADFWEALSAMATDGYIDKNHIAGDDELVYLWLPGIFQAYERNHRQRRGPVEFRAQDVKDWISRQSYWSPPEPSGGVTRRDRMRRMNGRPKRVIALQRKYAPPAVMEALTAVYKPSPGPDEQQGYE